jgi:precorrin-8X/cobalt-precorrin-8 methylmutase
MPGPHAIEEESFRIIDAEATRREAFAPRDWAVVRRMIHAAGDVSLEADAVVGPGAVAAGVAALRAGSPVWTDTRMAAAGISVARLSAVCTTYETLAPASLLTRPGVAAAARAAGSTRSAAAVRQSAGDLPASLLVVGNAPTCLEAALDLLAEGMAEPALVIGVPVGFVGAVESKERLVAEAPCPYITIRGRRGGSGLAAAAVNALAVLAAEEADQVPEA